MSEVVAPPQPAPQTGGMKIFLLTLLGLVILRTALGFVLFPDSLLLIANLLIGAIFLGAPMVALFFAGREVWTPPKAAAFLVGGLVLQFGLAVLLRQVPSLASGPFVNLIVAVSQAGLPIWTGGLGALIATLLKDKNMILPIAITLAILDLILVLTPIGTVNQVMQRAPQVFTSVALNVPKVQSTQTPVKAGHRLEAMGYAGPADFVFLSMFFVALFRYNMRTKETLYSVVPTLLLYLVLVSLINVPLPALVPIGAVILIVNRKEFVLSKDEKIATIGVAVVGLAFLIYGMTRPRPRPVPLPMETGQAPPGSPNSPGKAPRGSRRSDAPPASGNTPSPR